MKSLIPICLLLLSCSLVASADVEYVVLNDTTIEDSQVIQDLRQLGANYVLEQGIFHSNSTPLPNGSWNLTETLSVEAQEDGNTIYYKYAVILDSLSSNFVIRARYIVSYDRKSFNTLVTWFIYTDITGSGDDWAVSDLPSFIDVSLLSDEDSGLQGYLDEGVDFTVADAVEKGKLPEGDYRVARTFSIQDTGFSYPYGYRYLVKLADDDNGKYYRALITVWVTESEDQTWDPEYVIYPNKDKHEK